MGHPATAPTFAAPPPGPGTLLTTLLVLPCHGTYAAPRHYRAIRTTSVDFRLPRHHRRHAMPRDAKPRHAMSRHAMSRPLACPYSPLIVACWSTWPRRRHQVNVRTQLVRSTSLAYSLTISRTRHRRRRSGYITSLTIHHGRGLPSTDLAHHPLTLSLAVMYYVLRPRSRSMYTGHPRHRDPHSPRSLPITVCRSPKLRLAPLAISRRRRKPSPRRRFWYHRHYHHHRHHLHPPPTSPTSPTPPTPPTPPPSARRRRCRYRPLSPSPPN